MAMIRFSEKVAAQPEAHRGQHRLKHTKQLATASPHVQATVAGEICASGEA
jgi:hypothetical protein